MEILLFLLGALAVGVVVYLGVTLTASVIKKYRTRKNTKVLVADMETFIRNMPDKDKHSLSFEDLESYNNKQFISEFDPETNEIVQKGMYEDMDEQISSILDRNNGYIIVGE